MKKITEFIKRYPILKEGLLYGIIGLMSSSIDSLAYFLLRSCSVNLYVANFIGINIGITISFLCNTFVNFKKKDHLFKRGFAFFSVGYVGLCISMLIMKIFVEILFFNEVLVKIVSIIFIAMVQFALNKLITYRSRRCVFVNELKIEDKGKKKVKEKDYQRDNLYIVIPAYNEEENIESVAREWHEVVQKIGNGSKLVIINDGSKDGTYKKLCHLKKELPFLEPIDKKNEGHGATVLYGYNYALKKNASYIFQTDSDGQTIPDEFWQFWDLRHEYGAVIGHRNHRQDGFSRVFVTKTLKLVLFLIFGLNITDANTPFRLISRDTLKKYYKRIPSKFNLSNVMLTVLMVDAKENIRFIPITFRPRQGGVNSINFKKITKIGMQAVKDFRRIRKEMKQYKRGNHEKTNKK